MSLIDFRDAFLKDVLDLLWGQWCILGVPGHSIKAGPYCVDPEALMLATCSFGRYDQRLFDGMLEWLIEREKFVSLLRTSSLIKKEQFEGTRTMAAVGAFLASKHGLARWRKLAKGGQQTGSPEPLFRYADGSSLGSFGYQDPLFLAYGLSRGEFIPRYNTGSFHLSHPASLWLRLRALMGVASRTDAFLYLLPRRDGGYPSWVARELGYTQRGIDQALTSMTESGWVLRTESLRKIVYTISDPIRETFFSSLGGRPEWLTWAPFFRALEVIWQTLGNPRLVLMPIEGQSAELQGAMQEAVFSRNPGGFSAYFTEIRSRAGEAYIDSLAKAWKALFAFLLNWSVERNSENA